jgi:hypothetical protein
MHFVQKNAKLEFCGRISFILRPFHADCLRAWVAVFTKVGILQLTSVFDFSCLPTPSQKIFNLKVRNA